MAHELALTVSTDPGDLARLTTAVESFAERAQLAPDVAYALQLTLEEVVTNVMKYAYPADGAHTHPIYVHIGLSGDRLRLEVADEGRSFDPLSHVRGPQSERLEDQQIGGLGIELVKQLMDEVTYRREGDRNVLSMTTSCGGQVTSARAAAAMRDASG